MMTESGPLSAGSRLANDLFWLILDDTYDRLRVNTTSCGVSLAAALLAELALHDGSITMTGGIVRPVPHGRHQPTAPQDPVARAVFDAIVAEPHVYALEDRLAVLAHDALALVTWRLSEAGALQVVEQRRRTAYRSVDSTRSGTPAVRLRLRWKRCTAYDSTALFADHHDAILCAIAWQVGLVGELVGDGVPAEASEAVMRYLDWFVSDTDAGLGPLLSLIAPFVSTGVLSYRP